MNIISIEDFFKFCDIDKDFDEIAYAKERPGIDKFYQPYCRNSGIDDRHRLYFHYYFYTRVDKHRHTIALQNILSDLIDLNLDSVNPIIEKYVKELNSYMFHPFHCDDYILRNHNLKMMEKLIPYLPKPNITIKDENIV